MMLGGYKNFPARHSTTLANHEGIYRNESFLCHLFLPLRLSELIKNKIRNLLRKNKLFVRKKKTK